jgi:hypothetical protein
VNVIKICIRAKLRKQVNLTIIYINKLVRSKMFFIVTLSVSTSTVVNVLQFISFEYFVSNVEVRY